MPVRFNIRALGQSGGFTLPDRATRIIARRLATTLICATERLAVQLERDLKANSPYATGRLRRSIRVTPALQGSAIRLRIRMGFYGFILNLKPGRDRGWINHPVARLNRNARSVLSQCATRR